MHKMLAVALSLGLLGLSSVAWVTAQQVRPASATTAAAPSVGELDDAGQWR